MKTHHPCLFALLLALLLPVMLLSGCDLGSGSSSGNQNLSAEYIKIKSTRFEGNDIFVTYEDGFEKTLTVDEIALCYKSKTYVYSTGTGVNKNDQSSFTEITPGSNQTVIVNPNSSQFQVDIQKGDFSTVSPYQGGNTLMLGDYEASVLNAPRYVYANGELTEQQTTMMTVNRCLINGKFYEYYNDEIADYVQSNLKVAVVAGLLSAETGTAIKENETTAEVSTEASTEAATEASTEASTGFSTDLPTGQIKVTGIQSGGFANLPALERITLPAHIKTIGAGAFYNSPKLVEIVYEGTLAQWEQIKKEEGWDFGADDFTVQCTDGTVTPKAS